MRYRASLFVRGRRVKSSLTVTTVAAATRELAALRAKHPKSHLALEVFIDNAWELYE